MSAGKKTVIYFKAIPGEPQPTMIVPMGFNTTVTMFRPSRNEWPVFDINNRRVAINPSDVSCIAEENDD